MMKIICTLVFLGGNTWRDFRKREIYLSLVVVYGSGGVACSILEKRAFADWLLPIGMSAVLLGLAFLSRQAVGIGDGLVMLALGCFLNTETFVKTVMLGMLAAAAASAVLLVCFRKSRKTEIPLMPFLLLGYMGGFIL